MNELDRTYDYLKTLRWIFMIDNNLNLLLLLLFWVNHLKTFFWVLLVMGICQLLGEVILVRRLEQRLEMGVQ